MYSYSFIVILSFVLPKDAHDIGKVSWDFVWGLPPARQSSTVFFYEFPLAIAETHISAHMYWLPTAALDCFSVLRQSLTLTVKRMRMPNDYVIHNL